MPKGRNADLRDLAQGFGLLSDLTRLRILAVLANGTSKVTDLCKALKRKQVTVSYHLGLLRMGRLVNGIRQGKAVVFAADEAALKALAAALEALMPK